jgi:GntR family transcriptional regulator
VNLTTLREIAAISDPIERARALGDAMADQQGLVEEAARMRRQAIAEAREGGYRLDEIANVLGVSPGRLSQMRKGPTTRAPEPASEPGPQVIVYRSLPTEPSLGGPAHTFATAAERQGVHIDLRLLFDGSEPSSEHVATCMRIRAGDEVLSRRRKIIADGVPIRLVSSFFRADLFAGTEVTEVETSTPALQEALKSLGHRFGHAEETLVARPATRPETESLQLDPGEWVVQLLRAAYSTEDTPVHVLETICAASRHVFPVSQVGGLQEF